MVIAGTESEMCPVKHLERFFKCCGFSSNCSDFIFRNMSKIKSVYKVRNGNKSLTCTRIRELFIEAFECFVPNISKYGLHVHNLRAGGATVYANSGIPDKLFKRHKGGHLKLRRMGISKTN